MSILGILLVFVIVGFLTWLAVTYIPMPPPIKTALIIVVVVMLLWYVLSGTGLLSAVNVQTP